MLRSGPRRRCDVSDREDISVATPLRPTRTGYDRCSGHAPDERHEGTRSPGEIQLASLVPDTGLRTPLRERARRSQPLDRLAQVQLATRRWPLRRPARPSPTPNKWGQTARVGAASDLIQKAPRPVRSVPRSRRWAARREPPTFRFTLGRHRRAALLNTLKEIRVSAAA